MPRTRTAIGIDIGAHTLKTVQLRKAGSRVSLTRAGAIELGDLALLDESERKNARIAELLRFLLRQTRIRGRSVATGLSGHDYFIKYLRVPPTSRDKLRKIVEYESADDPTAVSKHTTDFVLVDLPTEGHDFNVLVAMARNEALHGRLGLLEAAKLNTPGATLNAIGLFSAYVHARGEAIYNEKTTLLVDIGAQHMDVAIQRNAKLFFLRNLTLGGQQFSEGIQEEYELPIKEAEELKLAQGAIIPDHFRIAAELDVSTPEARLSAALIEPAEAIVNTLQATIKYCMTQTRMTDLQIDEVVLSGRAARLRGLVEFLGHRLRVPVTLFDPLENLDLSALPPADRDDVIADSSGYAIAIGLALRELDDRSIKPITLLPAEVVRRREFLSRDAYIYAAAAVFLLMFGLMFYSSREASARAARDGRVEQDIVNKGKQAVDEFDGLAGRNRALARQAETIQRLLDTGRRTAETMAILKKRVPPQLRIDSMETLTETPGIYHTRTGGTDQKSELTTHLVLNGSVAAKHNGKDVTHAVAIDFVSDFLKSLEKEKAIFGDVKVNKYPSIDEPATARTFQMTVTFGAPFYGSVQLELGKKK